MDRRPHRLNETFASSCWVLLACVWTLGTGKLQADTWVPNSSFESPATPFVNTHVDSWQKSAKPDWYEENGAYTWEQLTGVFKNTPDTSPDHIDNCDGQQAMWMFVVPEVAIFQDYSTLDWNDVEPTHDFNVRFEPGKSYQLTVGVIGGGGQHVAGSEC